MEQNVSLECYHNDEERVLEGSWVSLELYKALELGYKLITYYVIYHFEETLEYDKEKKEGGLFTDYVNANLKEKQEASGFPSTCINDELKYAYIDNYFDIEGVKLDYENIIKNSGKREVAKIKLNCLWGYFALNTNKKMFKILTKKTDLENLLNNDQFVIHDVDFKDENFCQVSYSLKTEFSSGGVYSNAIIASFVTAQARLKLYSELERLQERVLYFDTDSILFVAKENEYMPTLGDYLGQFTNELSSNEGNFITEFVSGGPKNYAYKTDTGHTECTVKGYPINYLTSLVLNFDTIKHTVVEDNNNKIVVPQLKFIKDKSEWQIKTEIQNKEYRFIYDKRVLLPDLSTRPYGF